MSDSSRLTRHGSHGWPTDADCAAAFACGAVDAEGVLAPEVGEVGQRGHTVRWVGARPLTETIVSEARRTGPSVVGVVSAGGIDLGASR